MFHEFHELYCSHLFLNYILKLWYFALKFWNLVWKLRFSIKPANQPIMYISNTGFVRGELLRGCRNRVGSLGRSLKKNDTKKCQLHRYSQNLPEISWLLDPIVPTSTSLNSQNLEKPMTIPRLLVSYLSHSNLWCFIFFFFF